MSLRIIEWPDFLKDPDPESAAMTIGVFDGVHLGHRSLIGKIVIRGPNPTVVTFRENPKKVAAASGNTAAFEGDLYSLRQKLLVFESLGVSRVILIDFSPEFSKLKGLEFLDLLEERAKVAFLAIGCNFRCGFRQDADAVFIKEINGRRGIPTELVQPVTLQSEPVSSSRLRSAVISGGLELAASLAGRNFCLDLSDIKPVSSGSDERKFVYDLRSVQRIAPAAGSYSVVINPGGMTCRAYTENGKVFLPFRAESLEFIQAAGNSNQF